MQVLSEVSAKSETDLSQIPIVIADYHDNDSIRSMVSKCKVTIIFPVLSGIILRMNAILSF